ncbi:hypothetical protein ACVXG8_02830 [Escherichia coli]
MGGILQRWENARVPTSNLVKVPTLHFWVLSKPGRTRDLIDDARQSLKQLAERITRYLGTGSASGLHHPA